MEKGRKNNTGKVDLALLTLVLLLAVFGLAILFSASSYNGRVRFHDPAYYFKKQLFATALGLAAMYAVSRIDYHLFVRTAPAAYLASMIFSTLVLLVGREINGSKRWLDLGPLSFQPSEFAKVAVILFLAWQIGRTKSSTSGIWFMSRTMLTLLPIVGLVGSNNLSTAIIILGIGVLLIFVSNPRYLPFVGMGAAGAAFVAVFLTRKATVWSGWLSGGIRKSMKKVSRRSRAFTRLAAAGFSAGGLGAACRSWGLCRRPRMI